MTVSKKAATEVFRGLCQAWGHKPGLAEVEAWVEGIVATGASAAQVEQTRIVLLRTHARLPAWDVVKEALVGKRRADEQTRHNRTNVEMSAGVMRMVREVTKLQRAGHPVVWLYRDGSTAVSHLGDVDRVLMIADMASESVYEDPDGTMGVLPHSPARDVSASGSADLRGHRHRSGQTCVPCERLKRLNAMPRPQNWPVDR